MTDDDPIRQAEFHEANYKRVEVDVRTALRRSGCILPDGVIEALTCTVLEESLSTRRRVGYLIHAFTEAFADEPVSAEKLERLEMTVLLHQCGDNGVVYLPIAAED
jgi:hypothetical protein